MLALTALTARIRNNIIARPASVTARSGLEWQAGHPGISNDYNLLFNTANNTAPLGPNTVFADPQFQSVSDLRLKATSPAIDASDDPRPQRCAATPWTGGSLDGDGLRRSVGAQVDLGAFEFGDTGFVHNASAAATSTTVARPGLDGNAGNLRQITRSGGADSSTTAASAGPITQAYYLFTSLWSLLSDDGSTLPEGAGFTLLQSVPGGAAGTHVAVADNNFLGSGTSLGQQWSQLPADWVLLTSATRGIALDFSPNPHPFGAAFIDGAWRIINTDSANMPDNAMFVVHAQPPSHHAFRHTVSDANRITPGGFRARSSRSTDPMRQSAHFDRWQRRPARAARLRALRADVAALVPAGCLAFGDIEAGNPYFVLIDPETQRRFLPRYSVRRRLRVAFQATVICGGSTPMTQSTACRETAPAGV